MPSEGEEKYVDNTWPEWGVSYHWSGGKVVEKLETIKGTSMEMVYRPRWGLACYMNGEIQSCETDEQLYHESLVHPSMIYTAQPRRVLIIGGGEGATAREVLKWSTVERVDMYEWDADVIDCFKTRYHQWANGAWDDPRLIVHIDDIFSIVQQGSYPPVPYDVIIVDLFEPEADTRMWSLFSRLASDWLSEGGAMSMYAGIRNHWNDIHPAEEWLDASHIQEYHEANISINQVLAHRDVFSYKVFVPSFLGEAKFLLITHANQIPHWSSLVLHQTQMNGIQSHLTHDVWMAYHTWNRYHFPVVAFDAEGVFHTV